MKENPRPTFVTALLLALLIVISFDAKAEDVPGCMATYYSQSGTYLFEPFIKVADKTTLSEDGEPEVWGFRPWNLEPPDEHGKTHPVNIKEANFIPANKLKQVGPRTVRCPPFN